MSHFRSIFITKYQIHINIYESKNIGFYDLDLISKFRSFHLAKVSTIGRSFRHDFYNLFKVSFSRSQYVLGSRLVLNEFLIFLPGTGHVNISCSIRPIFIFKKDRSVCRK